MLAFQRQDAIGERPVVLLIAPAEGLEVQAPIAPLADVLRGESPFHERLPGPVPKAGVILVRASGNTEDHVALTQEVFPGELAQRREELAAGKVTGRAEDNEEVGRDPVRGHG